MITLTFNIFPISINKLYVNIPGQKRRFLSTEGKKFKNHIEETVKQQLQNPETSQYISTLVDKQLLVTIKIRSNSWFLKDAKSIRKKDLASSEKALTDSIFSAFNALEYSLDDSQIWSLTMLKEYVDGPDEVIYTISDIF